MASQPLYYPLSHTGFIRVSGPDATEFLHAQLAIDVLGLVTNGARLAPWLNPRGRVTGLFSLARQGNDAWLLGTHAALVPSLIDRLKLYVLRSAVQLLDASDTWRALAVGEAASPAVPPGLAASPDPNAWTATGEMLCRHTVPGVTEVWAPLDTTTAVERNLSLDRRALDHWDRQLLAAGIPMLEPGQQDRFTAHMLNLDLLDAVSFLKGCYPGQEVVARTENLGRPKRRTLLFEIAGAAPDPGTPIVDSQGKNQGEILRSVPGAPTLALALVPLAALSEALFLNSGAAARLQRNPLPYAVPGL